MISLFRDFTKSWAFKLVMVLLIASFAVFGTKDFFRPSGNGNVVTAGKRFVSIGDFKQQFDRYKQNVTQQNNGKSFSNEEFVESNTHLTMLEQLADKTAIGAWFDTQGIKPSAKLVVEQLGQISAFSNAVTGKFDKAVYLEALRRNNFEQKSFEQSYFDELAYAQFDTAALAGIKAPRIYSAAEGVIATQRRDISYFMVTPLSVPAVPTPTEAEIAAFYKTQASYLTPPEMRQASIITLSAQQFEAGIPVTDEQLHKAYDVAASTLGTPETRTFVQVTAPDMKTASAISAALRAGQSPEAAIKGFKGADIVPYNNQAQGTFPDGKVASAAFAMKSGEVSAPIQGGLGIVVIKMGEIKASTIPSFENAKPRLTQELRAAGAADKLNKVSNELSDALMAGDDFHATAQKLGLKISQMPPMTAEGRIVTEHGMSTGQGDDYSRYPDIVKTVYELQEGTTSDVSKIGTDQYYVIKLDKVMPAKAPPIEQARGWLINKWQQEKLSTAITDKANELMNRLNKGESVTSVAAIAKSPVNGFKGFDQSGKSNQGSETVPQGLVGRVFMTKSGEAFQVPMSPIQVAVVRVDGVHQGDVRAGNTAAAMARQAFSVSVARDVDPLAVKAARKTVKTKTYAAAAVSALGVTPPEKAGKDKSKTKDKS